MQWVFAALYRGLGLAEQWGNRNDRSPSEKRGYRLSAFALICNLTGSVLFVVGSFLFRPGFLVDCDGPLANPYVLTATTCGSILDNGVACYLIGSILFFADSLLNACLLAQTTWGSSE
eukprot:TRINITY_DN40040_c0_g1_i1.p2 TRINITY_DN40040_c0_g1~~TRINITY_DN40040_c0_g1_i1.p2  ORF type:complete len:118 (-),score=13.92 TRINITY_DN40040_c0_g1_i1:21-374(-)